MTTTAPTLDGRVAIVSGASAGLGRRFATVLAGAGARVYACARRLEQLESLAAEVPGVHPVRCDVSDDGDRRALIAGVVEAEGRIDVLVNNAGISSGGPDAQLDPAVFARVVGVNLEATFALTTLAGAVMLEHGGGSVVNISSMFGRVAVAPVSDAGYAASKAGLDGLTRELGAQWAKHGVRVNAIAPGWFPTDMNDGLMSDERSARWLERTCPMGRVGRPEELDGPLLFLAGDASSYCTGHVLVVDGGWTLR